MLTPFRKMHGAGNDFVVMDARAGALQLSPARIAALSDRNTGIGCDQFITLETPTDDQADVFMRIHNNDGSEAGTCGNATRCVVLLMDQEIGRQTQIYVVQTEDGILGARIQPNGITVDMGSPDLDWQDIPLAWKADTLALPIEGNPSAVSMGNPHATLFVDDLDAAPVTSLGPVLEHHPIFLERANIGFAQVVAPDRIRLRVWERGAGLTRACGSGACAAVVNACRRGLTANKVLVEMDGGQLTIVCAWGGGVLMRGPAVLAFQGSVDLATYPP